MHAKSCPQAQNATLKISAGTFHPNLHSAIYCILLFFRPDWKVCSLHAEDIFSRQICAHGAPPHMKWFFVQESARLTIIFFTFCAPEWSLRAWQFVCAQIFSAQYILSSLVFKHIFLNSVLVYFSQFCFNEACSKQMKIYKPLNLFIAFKCTVASTSDWPPDKNVMPGTATGVVLCRVVTVASATCSGVYFVGQDWPVKI